MGAEKGELRTAMTSLLNEHRNAMFFVYYFGKGVKVATVTCLVVVLMLMFVSLFFIIIFC